MEMGNTPSSSENANVEDDGSNNKESAPVESTDNTLAENNDKSVIEIEDSDNEEEIANDATDRKESPSSQETITYDVELPPNDDEIESDKNESIALDELTKLAESEKSQDSIQKTNEPKAETASGGKNKRPEDTNLDVKSAIEIIDSDDDDVEKMPTMNVEPDNTTAEAMDIDTELTPTTVKLSSESPMDNERESGNSKVKTADVENNEDLSKVDLSLVNNEINTASESINSPETMDTNHDSIRGDDKDKMIKSVLNLVDKIEDRKIGEIKTTMNDSVEIIELDDDDDIETPVEQTLLNSPMPEPKTDLTDTAASKMETDLSKDITEEPSTNIVEEKCKDNENEQINEDHSEPIVGEAPAKEIGVKSEEIVEEVKSEVEIGDRMKTEEINVKERKDDDEVKDEEKKVEEIKDAAIKSEEIKDEEKKVEEIKDAAINSEEIKDEDMQVEEIKAEDIEKLNTENKTEILKNEAETENGKSMINSEIKAPNTDDTIEIIDLDDDDSPEESKIPLNDTTLPKHEIPHEEDKKILSDKKEEPVSKLTAEKSEPTVSEQKETLDNQANVGYASFPSQLKEDVRENKPKKRAHSDAEAENRECANIDCKRDTKVFFKAPIFVLNRFQISNKKKNKMRYICETCFDETVSNYGELCGALISHKSLISQNIPFQPDLVEISDSDSDTETTGNGKENVDINDLITLKPDNEIFGEHDLEDIISATLKNIRIDNQMNWTFESISTRVNKNDEDLLQLSTSMKELEKMANDMYYTLYNKNQGRVIHELPAIDLNMETNSEPAIPAFGSIEYPAVALKNKYLAPRNVIGGAWMLCEVTEYYKNHNPVDTKKRGNFVKVVFTRRMTVKIISTKYIAYNTPPSVRLPVGTRVVAIFIQNPESISKNSFFPGIVGETLMKSNKYRYLIFFDDGYYQYVQHENVRLICEPSENVCNDIDINPGTKVFIQDYLNQYKTKSLRPLVQAKKGQKIITEFNGNWKLLKVVDIDSSLIKVYSEDRHHFEWIYRGSSRFAPIFKEKQGFRQPMGNHLKKRNEPYIEYVGFEDLECGGKEKENISQQQQQQQQHQQQQHQQSPHQRQPQPQQKPILQPQIIPQSQVPVQNRAVARKSTTQSAAPPSPGNAAAAAAAAANATAVRNLNDSVIVVDDDKTPRGKMIYYTATKYLKPKKYKPHKCSPTCLFKVTDNLDPFNPIARPLLCGWERQICKTKTRKITVYRAPCGKRMRNMYELHRYLRISNCPLNVECFDYDSTIHCLAEFVDNPKYIRNTDLSNGLEKMPISCCNYFDTEVPPPCAYSTERLPLEGCNLNLDEEFLCGCDCEDDCLDKTKCQCWQLSITGAKYGNPNLSIDDIGYVYKRLPSQVQTGIYECNSRCKCNKSCLNRVVQHPMSVKLQVFKTTNRGWGLRTLHDIPKGSFICIYAGNLLTEQLSNDFGAKEGDEYFAELDYIEVVERIKEGYESDIPDEEKEDEEKGEADDEFDMDDADKASLDSDDEDFTAPFKGTVNKRIDRATRSSARSNKKDDAKEKKLKAIQDAAKKLSNAKLQQQPSVKLVGGVTTEDCITISDDEDVREPVNFMPNTSFDDGDDVDGKYKSVRRMFGKDELGYVMDAKRAGNIGRYFNHSCNPNLFVQNVFVDTHDLRFPWVTFFSSVAISASTELTWNYNYDVGCVPGKVLYCQCESYNCRGRLL